MDKPGARITFPLLVVGLLFLAACTGSQLERDGVPLWLGLRLDSRVDTAQFARDLRACRELGCQGLALELLVQADLPEGLPKISRTSLTQFSRLVPQLQAAQLPLTLVFNHELRPPLFAPDTMPPPPAWMRHYRHELQTFLRRRCASLRPVRLVLGVNFAPTEGWTGLWTALLDSLRQETDARLLYATRPERVDIPQFWPACDELGIWHTPESAGNEKVYARQHHLYISGVALRHGLPVFLAGVNLLGNDKQLRLQNRLRFWSDSLAVRGAVLNSIFTRTPATDTLSQYYGIAHEPELLEFLRQYTAQPIDTQPPLSPHPHPAP